MPCLVEQDSARTARSHVNAKKFNRHEIRRSSAGAWAQRNEMTKAGEDTTLRRGREKCATVMRNFFRYTVLDMDHMRAAYDEVYLYTMNRPEFILQHVVDAFAVQTADRNSKPISVVFGLVGLYLRVEKQFSGRQ